MTSVVRISIILCLLISCWVSVTIGFLLSPSTYINSRVPSCYRSDHCHFPRTASTTTDAKTNENKEDTKPSKREITSSIELESCWDDANNEAASLSARGDTQIIGSPNHPDFVHPVVRVLHDRKRKLQSSKEDPNAYSKDDKKKIALVIEGGGMRGCVTAGMVCAIDYLGLRDCVDIVYGRRGGERPPMIPPDILV